MLLIWCFLKKEEKHTLIFEYRACALLVLWPACLPASLVKEEFFVLQENKNFARKLTLLSLFTHSPIFSTCFSLITYF